ncbi:Hypothetical protein FKW44_017147, partial [Caligus rogercresseyi]
MGEVITPICRLSEEEEETLYPLILGYPHLRQKMMTLEVEIGERRLSLKDFI